MYFTSRMLSYRLDEKNTLLINTISSAFDIVDNETFLLIERIKNGDDSVIDTEKKTIQALMQRGYLFADEIDEKERIRNYTEINQMSMTNRLARDFTICPTMGCNLRCTYCFEGGENHSNMTLMTKSQLATILHYIDSFLNQIEDNETGMAQISLFGGEPLLPNTREIVQEVLSFSRSHCITTKIVTNGTTIPQYADILREYKDNIAVQITLDGNRKIHDTRRISRNGGGTFDEIVSNIDLLVDMGIQTHLRTNVDRKNVDALHNLIDLIKEKQWIETGVVMPYVSPVLDYCDNTNNSLSESECLFI